MVQSTNNSSVSPNQIFSPLDNEENSENEEKDQEEKEKSKILFEIKNEENERLGEVQKILLRNEKVGVDEECGVKEEEEINWYFNFEDESESKSDLESVNFDPGFDFEEGCDECSSSVCENERNIP
eukprot:CAMPEP_0174825696 /NCGR_PEP_ID=MMETSP1107-20130205/43014_1 /TAXON_ID=36770 /ORGANISM="Paraphysomonas vestita, Strain GFlagA" /LENGTH=125 /DNA_ID=CAMNT_0016057559 /DNA_START=2105 /DNA_END=2483 /DNA_ORIENTATION=+